MRRHALSTAHPFRDCNAWHQTSYRHANVSRRTESVDHLKALFPRDDRFMGECNGF